MTTNQKGFSFFEIFIGLIVLNLIVAAGWLVYGRQNTQVNIETINSDPAPI
jgi:hypothetical protein